MSDPEGREEGDSVAEKVVQVLTKNQTGQDPPENTAERMGGESNSDKGLSSVAPTSGDNMSDGLAASMSSDELFSLSDDKRSQVPRVNCAEKIVSDDCCYPAHFPASTVYTIFYSYCNLLMS